MKFCAVDMHVYIESRVYSISLTQTIAKQVQHVELKENPFLLQTLIGFEKYPLKPNLQMIHFPHYIGFFLKFLFLFRTHVTI
jgi:hypothetical protein